MGLFGNKEKKLIEALTILSKSVLQCIFSVAEAITTSLKSEKEKSLTEEQDYSIKQEMLCFYLHYLDRIAIQEGGEQYYAWLQDNMVLTCSELLVELLFDTKNVAEDFDAQQWETRMVNECVDLYNKRGQEYMSLVLMEEGKIPKDNAVFGKLMFNINEILGKDKINNFNMMIEVPLWVMQSASNIKLNDQVRSLKKLVH